MSKAFDPYHVWMGIPPEEQPPNSYRLLGLALFEGNPEAIEHAVDQRMAYLRTLQAGEHSKEATELLNELSLVRIRLLNPKKKSAYDERLRRKLPSDEGVAKMASKPERASPVSDPGLAPAQLAETGSKSSKISQAPAGSKSSKSLPKAVAFESSQAKPPPRRDKPGSESSEAPPGSDAEPPPEEAQEPSGEASDELPLLGEYQLLQKLGEGGMGTVYKALHTKLGRVVALKILARDRVWDERAVARFDREMKAVGEVDHPNIVRAMDAREVAGTRLLVMEYVDGIDLNFLGRHCHPLPIADACEIVRQAAMGLEEVRKRGLVHRDVKATNLMVTAQGVVKILDLGLARFDFDQVNAEEVTGQGIALGTIDYMSPEQIADSRSVDIRADIYGLGCTFYKLLSCQPGEHTIVAMRHGFKPARQRVSVQAGEERMVSLAEQWVPEPKPETPHRAILEGLRETTSLARMKPEPKGNPQKASKPGPERAVVARPKPTRSSQTGLKASAPAMPDPAEKRLLAIQAEYLEAVEPAEALTADWNFAQAVEAMQAARVMGPELAARMAARCDELKRLAALKAKIITGLTERIAAASQTGGSLKKHDLGLSGANGEISAADESGLTVNSALGRRELIPWPKLGEKSVKILLKPVTNRQRADDWIDTGLLGLVLRDTASAESCFRQRRVAGSRYRSLLGPFCRFRLCSGRKTPGEGGVP